jgi:hypothetical protein
VTGKLLFFPVACDIYFIKRWQQLLLDVRGTNIANSQYTWGFITVKKSKTFWGWLPLK